MKSVDFGFTLVELLVVLIILGIIAGITILAFGNSQKSSVQSACKTNYQSTLLGIQGFQADNGGTMPASLLDLTPTYLNSGLLDTTHFAFGLQSLPGVSDVYTLVVADSHDSFARPAVFKSRASSAYTFSVTDVANLAVGMPVLGSGISSNFGAQGSAIAGATTINLDSAVGVAVGMSVIGTGIPAGASVASVDVAASQVVISAPTLSQLSSTGLIFGALPTVSAINPATGEVTLTVAGATITASQSPLIDSRYNLIFMPVASAPRGTILYGTAPFACSQL